MNSGQRLAVPVASMQSHPACWWKYEIHMLSWGLGQRSSTFQDTSGKDIGAMFMWRCKEVEVRQ